jgi:hypothetical protein
MTGMRYATSVDRHHDKLMEGITTCQLHVKSEQQDSRKEVQMVLIEKSLSRTFVRNDGEPMKALENKKALVESTNTIMIHAIYYLVFFFNMLLEESQTLCLGIRLSRVRVCICTLVHVHLAHTPDNSWISLVYSMVHDIPFTHSADACVYRCFLLTDADSAHFPTLCMYVCMIYACMLRTTHS